MMMDDNKGGEKELMEYLQTRQQLKERIRSKYRKDSNDMIIDTLKSTSDNYGSFFGPSQPSISQRVIEERNLVEFQNMTTKFINSHLPDAKNYCSMNIGGTDKTTAAAMNDQVSVQSKIKMLKESRDYSFLFSNDDAAAGKRPHDDQTSQAVLSGSKPQAVMESKTGEESKNKASSSDHREASSLGVSKLQIKPANHAKILGKKSLRCDKSKQEFNSVVVPKQQPNKKRDQQKDKSDSIPKKPATTDHVKVLGKKRVVHRGESEKETNKSSAMVICKHQPAAICRGHNESNKEKESKSTTYVVNIVPSKQPAKVLGKKRVLLNDYSKKEHDQSTHMKYKKFDDHMEKAKKPKLMPHDNNEVMMKTLQYDQKYPKVQPSKANSLGAKSQSSSSLTNQKTVQLQTGVASRKQTMLPQKQPQQIKSSASSSMMKKKKPYREPIVDYSSVISEVLTDVFRYDKTKYGRDYDDDRAMVSSFADIEKEEKRSERLGMKEDKEERILTEEMERKKKKLNQSKKRKLQAHQKD